MPAYNGHRSWNAWNVSLYINNEESSWRYCRELVKTHGVIKAARIYARQMEGERTPDGAKYNFTCIRECFQHLLDN